MRLVLLMLFVACARPTLAADGGYFATIRTSDAAWLYRQPDYWEQNARGLDAPCYDGATLDGGALTCSVKIVCGNHAQPRLEQRDGGQWLVCDARKAAR